MMRKLFLAALILISCELSSLGADLRYENLGNPTEYLFGRSKAEVEVGLKALDKRAIEPIIGGYSTKGEFRLFVMEYYTTRYWTGRREKPEEVDPPEAGTIGTISAQFLVELIPVTGKCLVRVKIIEFKQQVGRKYKMFPHFRKVPKVIDVKSDTYFEYYFLRKLGEVLGEKDMPPLKGRDEELAHSGGK